jgi:hypothetical protein
MGCPLNIWWHLNWVHPLERVPISSRATTFLAISLSALAWNGSKLGQADVARTVNAVVVKPLMHVGEKLLLVESGRALVESAGGAEPTRVLLIVASVSDADSLTSTTSAPLKLTVKVTTESATGLAITGITSRGGSGSFGYCHRAEESTEDQTDSQQAGKPSHGVGDANFARIGLNQQLTKR